MALPTLTRQQIARIVGSDQAAIRAFEEMLTAVSTTLPTDIAANALESAAAMAVAQEASAQIERLQQLVDAIAAGPVAISLDAVRATDIAPPAVEMRAQDVFLPPVAGSPAELSLADLAPPAVGGVNATFTTSDPFTVTVVDGRIVSVS